MKLITDYRKIRALLFIGLALFLASVLAYLKLDGTGKAIWTLFFLLSGFVYIAIGLLAKSRFELDDTYLEVNNIVGLGRKRINLSDIRSTRSLDKKFPVTAYLNNPLWLILTDKKFKRIKKIRLFGNKGMLLTIDGHLIVDSDYERLKKRLKKSAYNIV